MRVSRVRLGLSPLCRERLISGAPPLDLGMAHRRAVPILLLLSQLAILGYCHASHQIRFYIYGSASCPHSRRLNETLAQVYGAEAVVFNEVGTRRGS